jgi:hypothetical protein
MYVCMYVCTHACEYMYLCVSMYCIVFYYIVRVSICMYVCMYACSGLVINFSKLFSHMRQIIALKFQKYSRNSLFVKWLGVSMDGKVLDYFSTSEKFIAYAPLEMTVVGVGKENNSNGGKESSKVEKVSCTDKADVCAMLVDRPTVQTMEFAKYGARDVDRGTMHSMGVYLIHTYIHTLCT